MCEGNKANCRFLLVLLFAMLLSSIAVALLQGEEPEFRQMSLSSAVRSALLDSKRQMDIAESYSNSLQTRIDSLETQSLKDAQELKRLSAHLTNTMDSFRNLSAEFESLSVSLVREQEKVRARNTALMWAGILFLINVLAKIGAFICWGKGIRLPRWLDILI